MKRSEIKRWPLSHTVITTLDPEEKLYRVKYGGSERLYIAISPKGGRRWELRYQKAGGAWSWLGLGTYRDVNIEQARSKAQKALALLNKGIDPALDRAQKRSAHKDATNNSFKSVAEAWYAKKVAEGKAEKTLASFQYALKNDILPALGHLPVTDITRQHCATLQKSIEDRGAFNTAEKVRSSLNNIFGYAIAMGKCDINPASNLRDVASVPPEEQQYPHLKEKDLPAFLRALDSSPSRSLAKNAAWITIYTASRPGMVRHAEWAEFDISERVWTIPGSKMKMKRNHQIPLSNQVIALLADLRKITGKSIYLFPCEGSKGLVISDGTVNKCFSSIGYKRKMTGHGSRHTAATLLSEHGWQQDWIEAQLAHKKPGLVGVYNKAEYFQHRQIMMQWYCDYLDALKEGITPEQIVKFKKISMKWRSK